jgi:hypothetical protein
MSEPQPSRRIGRSIGAVLTGMLVGIIARLAPDRPMQHALVGGVAGLAVSILGAAVTWNKGPAFGPHWYPLALVVLALPQAWVGGKHRVIQFPARADA